MMSSASFSSEVLPPFSALNGAGSSDDMKGIWPATRSKGSLFGNLVQTGPTPQVSLTRF